MVLQRKSELDGCWVKWAQDGDSQGGPKSELGVLVQFGGKKKKTKKLNPSSWQPRVSQTPAQLLALRFFPPAGAQLPCCKGRCTGTCSKSRRLSGQGSCLSKGCVRSPESPASLHSERQKLLERVINSSVKH